MTPQNEMKKISILIADDHLLIRQAWSILLGSHADFSVVAECESGEEAVALAKTLQPDIILMDINLKGMNGIEATRQICTFAPGTKIVAVSLHSQPAYARKMMQMGAAGYVTKNSSRQEMIEAILQILSGKRYICKEIKDILSDQMLSGNPETGYQALSKREREIISSIRKGESSKEIATALGLSAKTVEVHRYNILKKLKIKNTAALIHFINTQQAD